MHTQGDTASGRRGSTLFINKHKENDLDDNLEGCRKLQGRLTAAPRGGGK